MPLRHGRRLVSQLRGGCRLERTAVEPGVYKGAGPQFFLSLSATKEVLSEGSQNTAVDE